MHDNLLSSYNKQAIENCGNHRVKKEANFLAHNVIFCCFTTADSVIYQQTLERIVRRLALYNRPLSVSKPPPAIINNNTAKLMTTVK